MESARAAPRGRPAERPGTELRTQRLCRVCPGVKKVAMAAVLESDGQRARAEARRPVRTVLSCFQGEREVGWNGRSAVQAVRSKGSWT